jgi:endonuclease/exonuclease/phosphatase family metal-dependent hydrolase
VSSRTEPGSFELLAGREHSAHPELAYWHGNIGHPVALDLASPLESPVSEIAVLSWNVAIGRAQLDEVFGRLRGAAFGSLGADPAHPLILLIQEAFRADPSVPENIVHRRFHGGHVPLGTRRDIVDFANEHGLSLRYAPSMRNGRHRSDRGNAVLSTVALAGARAYVLPYIRQRRVVVKVELLGLENITFVSAHLDTGGRLARRVVGRYGAGRVAQSTEMIRRLAELGHHQSYIIGADLNSVLGARDPAFRVFTRAGLLRAEGSDLITHTFHGPVRMLLDHVLYHSSGGRFRTVEVTRLDDHPGDRSRAIFGSDHHPLLARITLPE